MPLNYNYKEFLGERFKRRNQIFIWY